MNQRVTPILWQARGPRFLILLALGWTVLRAAALWPDPAGIMPAAFPPGRAVIAMAPPIAQPPTAARANAEGEQRSFAPQPPSFARSMTPITPMAPVRAETVSTPPQNSSIWGGADRHHWRYAMLASLVPQKALAGAVPSHKNLASRFPAGIDAPPMPAPIWPETRAKDWSLSAYSYWRAGSNMAPAIAANRPALLGGSQSAVRIDYAPFRSHSVRAFARVTATPTGGGGADLAIGATARPIAKLPVNIHVEHRLALAGAGRGRTLAYLAGGIDDQPLPHGFLLSAYGQGGVAGIRDPEAFVDGAVNVQRPVFDRRGVRLSLGAMLAGAAQRGAARVDVGPRATVRLPRIGEGASVSLDWRERIAGDAQPSSGLALTVATGF